MQLGVILLREAEAAERNCAVCVTSPHSVGQKPVLDSVCRPEGTRIGHLSLNTLFLFQFLVGKAFKELALHEIFKKF